MRSDEARAIRLVRITGGAVLALSIVMSVVMPTAPVRQNRPGFRLPVIQFELAGTPDDVADILGAPGDPRRDEAARAMDLGNRIDFVFMVAYPALFVAIARWLTARRNAPSRLVPVVGALALAMWAGDLVENLELLKLSHAVDADGMRGPLAVLQVATRIKWAAIFVATLLEADRMGRDPAAWGWTSGVMTGAGLLGLVGFVLWLPLVEEGSIFLGIGWLMVWINALRAPTRAEDAPAALAVAD